MFRDLLNEQHFHSETLIRIIDVIWLKEKKEKMLIINKCIYIVRKKILHQT